MNYKVMHRCGNGVWATASGFESLEAARAYALAWYNKGDNQIEIYVKCRDGWRNVVRYFEPFRVAVVRVAGYFADDCPALE